MSSIAGIIALLLVVLGFVSVGFFVWRSPTRSSDAGPFWYWAWATVLFAGAAAEFSDVRFVTAYVPPLLSPVFTGLLVAGALRYCRKPVPSLLLPATLVVGAARAVAEGAGSLQLSGALSAAVEPTGALVAAFMVHREATRARASWIHRAMPISLVALAGVEALGAVRGLFELGRLVIWPLWFVAGIPLAALQLLAGIESGMRAESQSLRDREGHASAKARLELLARNIREVIAELSMDGELLWVSESCREVIGLGPESLVGRPADDAFGRVGFELIKEGSLLGDGPVTSMGPRQGRPFLHVQRPEGGEERFFESRVARGSQDTLLSFTRNVTDEVLAERKLRASEQRFRTFSLIGSDYCFVATGVEDARVDNWVMGALEEISGYTHDELQTIGFAGFIHPDDMSASHERVMRLFREGGQSSHEFRMLTKSGETRYIAENLLIERDGKEFTIYGAARDISEQRLLEQSLARAQKLESLGLIAGGIAHDFNNLLMVILGNAELALETAKSASTKTDLEGIVDAVGQAQMLTRQLLSYAGRGGVERVPVDLAESIRSVSELLGVGATGVEFDFELKDGLPPVFADPGEIQQLTMNLSINAIESCEGAGTVRVAARLPSPTEPLPESWSAGELRPNTQYVVLEVEDDGVGMDVDTLGRVFDPFFTTKTAGRGLGLAAVAGIVDSVEGALHVESSPGEGTHFFVLLPVSSQALSTLEISTVPEDIASAHVLIVDDEVQVQRVAARILRSRGFEVSTADDGESAVAACERTAFDLVLLDSVMPGMSGADTFDAIRAIRPGIPVVMASGFDMDHAAGALLDRGLAGFIGKPFTGKDLLTKVAPLLRTES